MATIELTKKTFSDVVGGASLVLVDFWGPRCRLCRTFEPVFEQASQRHADAVFGKVDAEAHSQLAAMFRVMSLPTLVIIKEGFVIYARSGTLPLEDPSSDCSRPQEGLGWERGGKSDPMFAAENLRDWLGHTVIDPAGNKIGTLEAVYVDTSSDEPSFITVRVGMISRHRLAFVPVTGATVSPKAVRVQYTKKLVQAAPAIDTDGELAATAEPEVFAYYNLDYGSRSERRLARR